VISYKACGIAAGLAFVLSLIFGIFSGNGFFVVLFRAILFGAIFFGLFALGIIVISRFLPELLSDSGDDFDVPASGSRVDISVGSPYEGAFPEDVSELVDDIGGKPSTVRREEFSPLDQNDNSGYNEEAGFSGGFGDFAAPEAAQTVETMDAAETVRGEGGLPDMGSLSEESSMSEQGIEVESFSSPEPLQRYSTQKKPPIAENFDAKELAKAIQTALKRDEKG